MRKIPIGSSIDGQCIIIMLNHYLLCEINFYPKGVIFEELINVVRIWCSVDSGSGVWSFTERVLTSNFQIRRLLIIPRTNQVKRLRNCFSQDCVLYFVLVRQSYRKKCTSRKGILNC